MQTVRGKWEKKNLNENNKEIKENKFALEKKDKIITKTKEICALDISSTQVSCEE